MRAEGLWKELARVAAPTFPNPFSSDRMRRAPATKQWPPLADEDCRETWEGGSDVSSRNFGVLERREEEVLTKLELESAFTPKLNLKHVYALSESILSLSVELVSGS